MPYSFDVLNLETEGPIEVLGPKSVALVGGAISIYVRSLESKSETVATLKVKWAGGEERIQFVVE